MNKERPRKAATVSPDLLQPGAEIDDVVECRPLPLLAKRRQPANDGLERAEIQGQKKSGNGRYRDCQHDECRCREPMGATIPATMPSPASTNISRHAT